jgi:hypothetical protein
MALTREEILSMSDLTHKEITVPDSIPVWGGKKIYIKQLTRGDQDQYLKRQFGEHGKMRQGIATVDMIGLYGNDSWICSRGICDEKGTRIFTPDDCEKLDEKSGEFVGWTAKEILRFSNMLKDAEEAKELAEKEVQEELKN